MSPQRCAHPKCGHPREAPVHHGVGMLEHKFFVHDDDIDELTDDERKATTRRGPTQPDRRRGVSHYCNPAESRGLEAENQRLRSLLADIETDIWNALIVSKMGFRKRHHAPGLRQALRIIDEWKARRS